MQGVLQHERGMTPPVFLDANSRWILKTHNSIVLVAVSGSHKSVRGKQWYTVFDDVSEVLTYGKSPN